MFNDLATSIPLDGGLSGLKDAFINNWVAPVFLIVVAVVAVYFLVKRQLRELGIFILIAAIVGTLIFAGTTLLGSEDATLTGAVKDVAEQVNTLWFNFPQLM